MLKNIVSPLSLSLKMSYICRKTIGRPDKGASVVSLATTAAAAAIFANADDYLSIWVENPSQYT